jgi:hypothetical protein
MLTYADGGVISGIKYAGVAAVHAAGALVDNGSQFADLWYVIAPATGSNNLVLTWSTQPGATGWWGAAVFSGVNQTTPLGTAVSSTSGAACLVTVPTNGGGIDMAISNGSMSAPTQTQIFLSGAYGGSQYSLAAGSQSFHWAGDAGELAYPINSASSPVTVSITHGAVSFTGEPSHANEVDGISHVALSFAGKSLHVNQALVIAHAALSLAGQALHVNQVILIAHGALTVAGKVLHVNEAIAIAHAALSFSGKSLTAIQATVVAIGHAAIGITAQVLHVNEAISVGHAVLAFTGRSLTSLGNSVVSIAHAVMGFTGNSLSAALKAIRAVYLNVLSMWAPNPRSRGY